MQTMTQPSSYSHYHKYPRVDAGMTWPCLILMICILAPVCLIMCPIKAFSGMTDFVMDQVKTRKRGRVESFLW